MSENNLSLRLFFIFVRLVRSIPVLHRLTWRMRKFYNRSKRWLWVRRPVVDAGPLLYQIIKDKTPYAAGKMGSIEAACLGIFLKREQARAVHKKTPAYSPYLYHSLHVNAGVFPQDINTYDVFCGIFLKAVSACNMLVAWDVAGEAEVFRDYCKQTILVDFLSLEPFFSQKPWTRALKGKRVLVISPFIDSIKAQYAIRETLWDNPDMLPAFDLITLRTPLSAGLVTPIEKDWNETVARLKQEMDGLDYDVALIGAGAFSLPLAVHAMTRGKIGIHLGGVLQILFGVSGARWKRNSAYHRFIKETWRSPSREETPQTAKKIEEGCYW